jgi:integrase
LSTYLGHATITKALRITTPARARSPGNGSATPPKIWACRAHARTLEEGQPQEGHHTYASIGIAAGLNPKTLSTYLGHATITITLDRYGHLMPGSEVEARALLDAYLED